MDGHRLVYRFPMITRKLSSHRWLSFYKKKKKKKERRKKKIIVRKFEKKKKITLGYETDDLSYR